MFNGRHQIDKERVKKWLEEKRAEESETQTVNENGRWMTPDEVILEKIETQNETIKQHLEEIKELKATKNENKITEYEPEKPTPTLLKRVEEVGQKILDLIGDPFIKQNIKGTFERANNRIGDLEKLVNIEVKTIGQGTDNIFDMLKTHGEYITNFKQDIDELKEEMFSLTKDVERLQECEKMEQEEIEAIAQVMREME